ncbi:Asp/Glu/hydantoin racemase [Pseudomonas putida S11]|nr:Asp/Glu/hydantoin racemase [Pseudomonas putida S11]
MDITDAAASTAMYLGHAYSVVTTLDRTVPLIEDRLKLSGLYDRCASVRASGLAVLELEADPQRAVEAIVEQAERAVGDDKAEVICLGCGGSGRAGRADPPAHRRAGGRWRERGGDHGRIAGAHGLEYLQGPYLCHATGEESGGLADAVRALTFYLPLPALSRASPAPTRPPPLSRAVLYLWERASPRRGRYRQTIPSGSGRAAMRTIIQALTHIAAEQAGLAVVPGQGQDIEGVEVVAAPVLGDHPLLTEGLASHGIDQVREVAMRPGGVHGRVTVLVAQQLFGQRVGVVGAIVDVYRQAQANGAGGDGHQRANVAVALVPCCLPRHAARGWQRTRSRPCQSARAARSPGPAHG